MATGDRVIFKLANQRVDKKDLEDLSILNQEVLSRTVGALIGDTSGVLTNIPYEWDPVEQILSLGTFVLAWGSPFRKENGETVYSPENYLEGGVLIHDPTRPGQAGYSEVDLESAPNICHLWFRREEIETDNDNRAYWPADSEQVTVTATRKREVAFFSYTVTAVDEQLNPSTGWFRFAVFYKTGPGDAAHTLMPLSAFGDNRAIEDSALLNANNAYLMGVYGVGTAPNRERPWGIGRLTQEVIASLLRVRDSQLTIDTNNRALLTNPNQTNWRDTPSRGIFQLDRDLTQLTSDLPSFFQGDMNRPGVLCTIVHSRNIDGIGVPAATTVANNGLALATTQSFRYWDGTPAANEDEAIWWLITLSSQNIQWPQIPDGLAVPYTYDSAVITSVVVQPHHYTVWQIPDTQYDTEISGASVTAELQQLKAFPATISDLAGTQKLKLRFRNDQGNQATPGRGWTMTVFGYLTQSTTP